MNEFEPGEGWREVPVPARGVPSIVEHDHDGGWLRAWVREASVLPLPTEPYTVIRTKGRKGFSDWVLTLNEHGHWAKHNAVMSAAELPRFITGFEVLAEPVKTDLAEFTSDPLGVVRRQTAKAILHRVRQVRGIPWGLLDVLDEVAREFGVSS